ncbi:MULTISPECIES: electron transfer flavoprotein subunit beta/FixA family protein [Bacillus]|uniref:electron transfer flavoprotein subunit beta/FixA family protein n=1 Tax=Bacillus TaxID=1386 RepID=UPI000B52E722|nr:MULTISPECIES: electron transfer flavoprotein subunit beta/FixA family protein [Bacillus]MBP3971171.1 electron transfer flavoprotein subunit beta/FixA family protein [Bacillus sp. WL1]MCU5095537.1 electron transfer flavoprotein subunit beta/FixA family protein [Bacillus wiedmannii]MDD0821162.1 electron transfer flavoprotein subunit beta/FixA family protein [Bacillus cereus]OWW11057.1 hypothetical protein BUE63_06085 [Bacillus sp. MB353a]
MKIVICIKPVKSVLVDSNESLGEDFVINPFDLYALKKTVQLKKWMDCQLIVLSMGPISSKTLLQKAVAAGADDAILLNDERFLGSDTVATSYILASAIQKIGNVDLVACGRQSVDGETGHVVYGMAERLKFYCMSNATGFLNGGDIAIKVKQVKESEMIIGNLQLPAIVSFHDYIMTQHIVNLLALKRARKKEILVWNADDLGVDTGRCGLEGSKTKVVQVQKDIMKKKKMNIDGTAKEKAEFIYNIMSGKTHNEMG